jgi:hypothetical protein
MRDLLDKLDALTEDRTLAPNIINKNAERFNSIIGYLRGPDARFYFAKQPPGIGQPFVVAAPDLADEWETLKSQGQFSGTNVKVRDNQGRAWPVSAFLKTAEFGGQAAKPGEEGEIQKEAALLKPTQIGITDKPIAAGNLGKEIINNPTLQSTDYGRAVIQMAQQIMAGKNPVLPKELIGTKIGTSIQDYAGEYLGVLAMVTGVSDFPYKEEFLEWLGGDLKSLTLEFPSKANTNIADSYASITNKNTNHKINISSKGEGGGAPPSVGGLKIPDEIRDDPKFQTAVDFIDLADTSRKGGRFQLPEPKTVSQVFQAMNLLHERVPDSVPAKFQKFLPWDISIVDKAIESMEAFKDGKEKSMPRYKSAWSDIRFKKPSSDGGKLVHAVKLAVMEAVNEGQAIPNFQDVILRILGMNFIQQYALLDGKSGVMTFRTQWPAQLRGKVSLESKSGATDPRKGGFSFKLANTDPVTRLEQPDEGGKMQDTGKAQSKTDLDDLTQKKRLTGPGASAARRTSAPRTDANTLGRERRSER